MISVSAYLALLHGLYQRIHRHRSGMVYVDALRLLEKFGRPAKGRIGRNEEIAAALFQGIVQSARQTVRGTAVR